MYLHGNLILLKLLVQLTYIYMCVVVVQGMKICAMWDFMHKMVKICDTVSNLVLSNTIQIWLTKEYGEKKDGIDQEWNSLCDLKIMKDE